MSVMNMWSVCDRCGFNYRRRQLHKETTGFVVCTACYDGYYDKLSHPQNKPPPPRREPSIVPDGRPQQIVPPDALLTDTGDFIVTNNGDLITVVHPPWTPAMSTG